MRKPKLRSESCSTRRANTRFLQDARGLKQEYQLGPFAWRPGEERSSRAALAINPNFVAAVEMHRDRFAERRFDVGLRAFADHERRLRFFDRCHTRSRRLSRAACNACAGHDCDER